MNKALFLPVVALLAFLTACASTPSGEDCPAGTQKLPDCPPLEAVEDPFITALYWRRAWQSGDDHQMDMVDIGIGLDIPEQNARAKFLGARSEDALNYLAAKIWMIENAQHTIDMTYYIFKRDLIGEAMLGALCNAVKRGVDIRFMVDSVGSIDSTHSELKALETCADEAGFMRNAKGQLTNKKARIQVVVFNAVSNVFVRLNRRSHDKLIVIDGRFDDKAMVMTGGRNVSLSYYGITENGSPNPDTYMDAEILLRTSTSSDPYPMGALTENYYTLLFLFDDVVENLDNNENSISYMLRQIPGREFKKRRIVSPYLFAAQYYDKDGNIVLDGANNIRDWLDQHPDATMEIITNSVLTSDNFSAQSVIDMNMAPRLLLSPELQEAWLDSPDDSEATRKLVTSEEC